jgi:hypothetical protein
VRLRGYEARNLRIVESEALPVSLKEGLLDLDVSASLEKGGLTARIAAGLRSARLLVEKRQERPGLAGRVDEAIRSALAGVTSLNVSAEVSGTPDKFEVKVRSDIDDVLKSAVSALVRDQVAGLERDLQAAIGAQVAGPLDKLNLGVKGLDLSGGRIDALNKRLSDLLKKLI